MDYPMSRILMKIDKALSNSIDDEEAFGPI